MTLTASNAVDFNTCQVDRSSCATLQACIHAVELALRELDRIGFSFESGIHRQSALQLPTMMMLGKEQLSGL